MIKVLFICHGNICRSPMAEFMFKKMVKDKGRENDFYIRSAATSYEEIGNPVYPPARKMLNFHGIRCDGKTAVHFEIEDYYEYDYILCMDTYNIRNLYNVTNGDPDGKIRKVLDYTDRGGDVADPWYTRDFNRTYEDLLEGLTAFYETLPQ
ncbi:MAG: low molecular weight phosphotyrosine protein phosphatase [Lachnospiraceae bacterium]|nr:low molecular weight phosphotyrosine protein phosphatase [Lachnospiraceae bacterium]